MNQLSLNDKLNALAGQLGSLLPEGALVLLLLALLVINAIRRGRPGTIYGYLAGAGLLTTFILQILQPTGSDTGIFANLLVHDSHAAFVRLLSPLAGLLTVGWSMAHSGAVFRQKVEYYALLIGLVLGAMVLSAATHLLSIYLALELLSLSAYLATHLREDKAGAESSFKYLVFGAINSAFLLYSLSWVYGLTGTLHLLAPEFWEALAAQPLAAQVVLAVGVTLGVAFKISAAPGHLWAPDVYETAPLPMVAFFSVVPKVAAATLLLRLGLNLSSASFLQPYFFTLWPLLISATLLVGNLAALSQRRAMRLMAYSSIAHSGFLLLAALPIALSNADPFRLYAVVYLVMNFSTFGLIQYAQGQTGTDDIRGWKGLGLHLPTLGVMMLVAMISLVGLPPTAGFMAKLLALAGSYAVYEQTGGIWVAIAALIGLFSTVLSLFYYLRIPFFLFFKKNENFVTKSPSITYLLVTVGLLTLGLVIGFFRSDLVLAAVNTLLS